MGRRAFSRISAVLMVLAVTMAFAAPVMAKHGDGHKKGKGKSQSTSAPSDQADDGDNKHPSGKDRSVENDKSGTQGKATSDPDDDGRGPDRSNGGPDKPGGSGGVDKDDQDGNNGCGNDDDFEDDNEGWCGGNPKKGGPDKVKGSGQECPEGQEMVGDACVPDSHTTANDGKIRICHATGSSTNPYVMLTISVNGMHGHGGHADDIVPAPEGGCPASLVAADEITEGADDTPCVLNALMEGAEVCDNPDEVIDEVLSEAIGADVELKEDGATAEGDSVLGAGLAASDDEASGPLARAAEVLGGALPFTGAGLVRFLILAAALVLVGLFLARRRSSV